MHINLWMYILYTCPFYIVTSFLELGPLLLQDRNVKFLLTESFCQDTLECYFGDQRSRGRKCDNPTVQQFSTMANILRVATGLSKKEQGNVRGREENVTSVSESEVALRKRNQKRSVS